MSLLRGELPVLGDHENEICVYGGRRRLNKPRALPPLHIARRLQRNWDDLPGRRIAHEGDRIEMAVLLKVAPRLLDDGLAVFLEFRVNHGLAAVLSIPAIISNALPFPSAQRPCPVTTSSAVPASHSQGATYVLGASIAYLHLLRLRLWMSATFRALLP